MNNSLFTAVIVASALYSCAERNATPSKELIDDISLKRGNLISCGSADKQFGNVAFDISCDKKIQEEFNLGVKLLHSFEYDEAEKVFADIISAEPDCAMSYWGVAMANFHPLWSPPTPAELEKGNKAVVIAKQLSKKTKREKGFIDAIASFYTDWENVDHRTRTVNFEQASGKLASEFPEDDEAKIFYSLSLIAAADPTDKTYEKQKKANRILVELYNKYPGHPGIVHYRIHANDYPELAHSAIEMANRYAAVAPSSAHALHMPSHIFTRLGMWQESINSNLASVDAAKCYAEASGIKGHWDEELHGMDYLVYAYLQSGDNDKASQQIAYLDTISVVQPVNFKVAYAFAAIPSRYVLENKLWSKAASLEPSRTIAWENFAWQKAIIHFTKALGFARSGNLSGANSEIMLLEQIHKKFISEKDTYKATQLEIQLSAARAWVKFGEKKDKEAFALMNTAADLENKTEKHPVTPGEVVPAMELLADMYMERREYMKALNAYEEDLKKNPNRFNALFGAGKAAELAGDISVARTYFDKLVNTTREVKSQRSEINYARNKLTQQASAEGSTQ